MIILLLGIALVALLVSSAFAFDNHCESRFDVSIFELKHVLVNVAGWALVAGGAVEPAMGIVLALVGALILVFQLVRLIAQTSVIHGFVGFTFLTAITAGIIVVILLVFGAASGSSKRRVIVIE